MNEIFTVAGIGIIASALIIILKQYKPEFAFATSLISGTVLFFYIITSLSGTFDFLKELISLSGIEYEKYEILFRCLGIGIVSKIASEACSDCGQGSISSKIDFAGKAAMLYISVPLFSEIIIIIKSLIEL